MSEYKLITKKEFLEVRNTGYPEGEKNMFRELPSIDIKGLKTVCKAFVSIIDDCPEEVRHAWNKDEYAIAKEILKQLEGVT